MNDDVKRALEELTRTFAIVHRKATHQTDEAYMSIPANPKRDADLRHAAAVEALRAHIDAEPARLAAAREEHRARRFPVQGLDCSVPWSVVAPFEARAQRNHGGQTLERLADRGGLSPTELWCVVHGVGWERRCHNQKAETWVRSILVVEGLEKDLAQRAEKAEARVKDLEAWQREVAQAAGYIRFAEGQGGYEVAEADVLIQGLALDRQTRNLLIEKTFEATTRAEEAGNLLAEAVEVLRSVERSAHPNPHEHPAMSEAWRQLRAFLAKVTP